MPDHGIEAWLLAGFIAGMVAKFLSGGWDASGCIGLVAVGVLGALTAGWGWSIMMGWGNDGNTDAYAAIGGAIFALWAASILAPRR